MIKNRFLHYKTRDAFEADLNSGQIENAEQCIAFIQTERLIWTHGEYYGDTSEPVSSDKIKHVILTQEAYDALTEYDNNTLYFIVNIQNESWTFGNTFPITFGTTFKFGGTFPITLT